MLNNRKKVITYKGYTIFREYNYKDEPLLFSIVKGEVGEDFSNAVKTDYGYLETLESAKKTIDLLLEEEPLTYSFSIYNGIDLTGQRSITKERLKESLLEEVKDEIDNIEPNTKVELKITIERK